MHTEYCLGTKSVGMALLGLQFAMMLKFSKPTGVPMAMPLGHTY